MAIYIRLQNEQPSGRSDHDPRRAIAHKSSDFGFDKDGNWVRIDLARRGSFRERVADSWTFVYDPADPADTASLS